MSVVRYSECAQIASVRAEKATLEDDSVGWERAATEMIALARCTSAHLDNITEQHVLVWTSIPNRLRGHYIFPNARILANHKETSTLSPRYSACAHALHSLVLLSSARSCQGFQLCTDFLQVVFSIGHT